MEEVEKYVEDGVEENQLFELADLASGASRSEKLYGGDWKKKVLNKGNIPLPDVMYFNCPRHAHYLMTPIKIFRSAYGYSVTFQCHHIDKYDTMCLIIAQINEATGGNKAYLRPGDILPFEGWEKSLEHVQLMNMNARVQGAPESQSEEIVLTDMPPNPYAKPNSVSYILWDVFWSSMVKDGFCSYRDLEDAVKEKKGDPKSMKQIYDWTMGSEPITDWMTRRTGFVFKMFGESWKIVGRTEGQEGNVPWNDDDYRRKFGFA